MKALVDRWHTTMNALAVAPADDVVEDLAARWSEPHRHYHVVAHLEHCLREIDALAFSSRAVAELAAWFHDAIYVTQPNARNEQESAALAERALAKIGVADEVRARVCAIVLATEHHDSSGDHDTDTFLDVDMCILGQPHAIFDAYDAGVRAEWSWVPDAIFREKRAEFLRGLRARDTIFLTDTMRGRYEIVARANIERALARLADT